MPQPREPIVHPLRQRARVPPHGAHVAVQFAMDGDGLAQREDAVKRERPVLERLVERDVVLGRGGCAL